MNRIHSFSASLALMILANVQLLQAQSIHFLAEGKLLSMDHQQTQSEMKAGWTIAGIQTKSTIQRYLWGANSKQLVDNCLPQFVVDTDTLLLSDMALIKLKAKREYRRIPQPEVEENACIYVDFSNFDIRPYGEESFLIRPLQPLPPGEYIFTWITGPRIGELQDWMVWPFSVK